MNLAELVNLNKIVHFEGLNPLFADTTYLKYLTI